jgi:hypothetical protein
MDGTKIAIFIPDCDLRLEASKAGITTPVIEGERDIA